MANANNSVITGKFRGALGKELVFREWEGKTVVAKAPKARTGNPTPGQVQTQDKFLLASRYAKAVIKGQDQGIRDAYSAALRPRQNLYSRALEDFLSPPVVKKIGTGNYTGVIGSTIKIRAVDDFRVTSVQVEIHAANGTLLEKGDAVQQLNGVDWTYTATQANNPLTGSKINAIATDVPGNEGTLEITL
ncbi:MAG TPA: hypothetical protein VGZ90_18145 [Puia sp.]|jgi:hypothetical protein|nr:hypothetical protein [Puia sp.]